MIATHTLRGEARPRPATLWLACSLLLIALCGLATRAAASEQTAWAGTPTSATLMQQPPLLGIYVHTHWSYNHPYAARTWTIEDWEGYLEGLHQLGYDALLYWPVLETIPDPPTPSDVASLERFAKVIDIAHKRFNMKVFITMSPNVVPKSDVASTYTWENRRFFDCDDRINPRDVNAVAKIVNQRQQLITYLKAVDGIMLIDSDPGGWPGSTNIDFVAQLSAYRTMFDAIRPGIILYYWAHAGWEAYSRFYATANFKFGEPEEFIDAYKLLDRQHLEPWGIASGHALEECKTIGMQDRVLSFRYGAIEGEPTFPMTNFGQDTAWEAAKEPAPRGRFGNAQSHCMQLPYTFAFARGAQGKPLSDQDYTDFANQLLEGLGPKIVAAWSALGGTDKQAMRQAGAELAALKASDYKPGPLKGLLFGDPQRFITDIIMQLELRAALEDFHADALATPQNKTELNESFGKFIDAAAAWQQRHGYRNNWNWPRMEEALLKVDDGKFAKLIELRTNYRGPGETPFDRIKSGYRLVESYTPDLIAQMRVRLEELKQ